jgi:hypothetical protein
MATLQCFSFRSREIIADCHKWRHQGHQFEGIKLLFRRSLIQKPKCPCDYATIVTNIWVYYKVKKKSKQQLKRVYT